jgi:hypothetical protein
VVERLTDQDRIMPSPPGDARRRTAFAHRNFPNFVFRAAAVNQALATTRFHAA